VGDVSKRDITEAVVVKEHEPLYGAILAFNVKTLPDAENEAIDRSILIFKNNIIYHLIDDYLKWMKSTQEERIQKELDRLVRPGKIKILPGYVFRRAKPAIVGIEVLSGQIKPKYELVGEDGRHIGEIKQIQDRGQAIAGAETGMQVAVSLDKPVVGRHINEGDVLRVKVPEAHAKALLTKFQDYLSPDELETLNELINIMRRRSPFWAT
jgi:translation initiation factor 5B